MTDATEWLKQLNHDGVHAILINGKMHSDYPDRDDGRILRRLCKSCCSIEVGTTGYNTYFGNDEKPNKAKWDEKNLIVCGFTDALPELPKERLYLNLKNSLGKNLVITWEDE